MKVNLSHSELMSGSGRGDTYAEQICKEVPHDRKDELKDQVFHLEMTSLSSQTIIMVCSSVGVCHKHCRNPGNDL